MSEREAREEARLTAVPPSTLGTMDPTKPHLGHLYILAALSPLHPAGLGPFSSILVLGAGRSGLQ